jgi:hypothetical protein
VKFFHEVRHDDEEKYLLIEFRTTPFPFSREINSEHLKCWISAVAA